MNREQLQKLASEWTRMAKNDIKNKLISFMREVDANERELAYVLAISEDELKQILDGNKDVSLSTFAKILIMTGNALEIKPIEDIHIGSCENIPTEEGFNMPLPHPNVFNRQKSRLTHPQFGRPTLSRPIPIMDEDDLEEFDFRHANPSDFVRAMAERVAAKKTANGGRPTHRVEQPRDEHGRFAPTHPQVSEEVSPFESMSTDKLAKIIRERLWDSEINLYNASKEELVNFLDEKNKRMHEYKRIKELEEDPNVLAFRDKMKKTLDSNPHLREWTKKFLGQLCEE